MAVTTTQPGGFVVSLDVVRLSLYTWWQGQLGMNDISYYVVSITGGTIRYGDIANWFATNFDPSYQVVLGLGVQILGWKCSSLKITPPPLPGIATDTLLGTGSTLALPTQDRGLVSFQTSVAGRAYRGRIYIPFPSRVFLDVDSTPTAAYVTNIQGLANTLISTQNVVAGPTTAQLEPVIWHRKAGKAGVPAAKTFDFVIGANARKAWATQRKSGDLGRLNTPIIS